MRELTVTEQFALIALTGQDSKHETAAKKMAVIGIAIAQMMQNTLFDNTEDDILKLKVQLENRVIKLKGMRTKERKKVEEEIVNILKAQQCLTEIPNILGCDINYYTANVTMKEYKSDEKLYMQITESIRAAILEPGDIPEEIIILLWLIRECGCMCDIFSVNEQCIVENRLLEISMANPLYQMILSLEFHDKALAAYKKFLSKKRNLFKNPYLEGVNLLFPFLDRRQAIFIDMVITGTTVKERRQTAIDFLIKQGHSCEEIKSGTETIVKVDNGYYRIFPATRRYQLPVQGIQLLPVYK